MKQTLCLGDKSQEELNKSFKFVIDFLTSIDPKVNFSIANSIWCRKGINFSSLFLSTNRTYFNAVTSALDFNDPASPEIINNWVSASTNGKINKIIDGQINPSIIMYLINAIYFKGDWKYQFDKNLTTDDLFYSSPSSQVNCKMMNQKEHFNYQESDQFQAIDLPYANGNYSMTIILPTEGSDINNILKYLSSDNWKILLENFRATEVNLTMPKFTMEYEIHLNDVLKHMGMGIAFDSERADFLRMIQPGSYLNGNLFISDVLHKTFIKVDEEGTEAAAVTSVSVGVTSIENSNVVMR